MNSLKPSLTVGILTLGLFLGGCTVLRSDSQTSAAQPPHSQSTSAKEVASSADDAILQELLADDIANAEELEYYDKASVTRILLKAQPQTTGKRAIALAYLLASLNQDYEANCSRVMAAFNQCLSQPPGEGCDEDIVGYVVSLCYRGDDSLLKPLLTVGPLAQGPVAETLSAFYSETIADDTEVFLKGASNLPYTAQRKIATLMASDLVLDPDEAISDDVFDEVYKRLSTIRHQKASPLSASARICLEAIDQANKEQARAQSLEVTRNQPHP